MWTRENGTWTRYKFEQTQRRFKEEYLEQILMYQKCVNAVTYMPIDNLENIYNLFDYFTLDNWSEYHNTIKSYYTPGNVIDNQINIIQVDLASTIDIDVSQEYINPIIDNYTVIQDHLILLKDQTNTAENGIYKFNNRKFEPIIYLENYLERLNFTTYVKLGDSNKHKQFLLNRNVLSLYPTDTDPKTFYEGHNYIVKHKFEYKNLRDVTLHDIAIKTDSFSASGVDVRHNMGGLTEIVIENVPAGTLPSVAGGEIFITVIGHSDIIFIATAKILSEVVVPNGPNFDHTYTTDLTGLGPATATETVDVRFDYNISFTVGEFGLLIKDYSDFTLGRTTKLIDTGSKSRLRGVYMSSDSFNNFTGLVYTVGNYGTILKSIDYGETFEKLSNSDTTHLHDVDFYNSIVGIAVGERGVVQITEDGGLSWKKLQPTDLNEQKTFNAVFMNSLTQAIIIGNRGMFFVADKIGSNWTLTRINLIREESSLISYPIINDLTDIVYTGTYYFISGSEGFLVRIDSDFNLVFFQDNSITTNFNSIVENGTDLILVGQDNYYHTLTPTITLNPDSNVSTATYVSTLPTYNYDDHEYSKLVISYIDSTKFAVGNHTFHKTEIGGAWLDISSSLFDSIKSKLLVLDYKLGRKMYFIDNNGDAVKPEILYDFSAPTILLPGIDILSLTDNDTLDFHPYSTDHNFWEYYIQHNLYDPITLITPNIFTIKNVIAPYRYAADNIISGGATDFVVYDNYIELKLTNTPMTLNPGDLIKVTIKETVPSFGTFLEGIFMVISWDGTNAIVNEVFSDAIQNDLYNGPFPFEMSVINLSYIEEGNTTDFVDNLNDAFFGFYNFAYDVTNTVLTMQAADENLTTYFNMRMEITDTLGNQYVLDYKESDLSFKYGPYYNILNVLADIDPIFTSIKTFSMPQITFAYESSGLSPNQFVFDANKIVFGLNHEADFEQYFENTFIDIIHNAVPILTRVMILKKETVITNGITRYHLYLDNRVQDLVSLYGIISTDNIELKSRNTLGEISYDLTRGDDVHHDMFQQLPTDNLIYRRYKEGIATFNTDNYAKILMQDSDIKQHVTGIIYTDSKHDLAFNVINVTSDPSFNYEPVDIYDIGVDEIPKLANAIDPINVETYIALNGKTGRRLINIDFKRYAFRLVDGLNLVTLSQKYGWILDVEMKDAIIGEDSNGLVWYNGEWFCGIWADGTWYSGIFHDGIWVQGTWNSNSILDLGSNIIVKSLSNETFSNWYGGTWLNGVWNHGTHFDGDWQFGTWNDGLWLNGQWDDGTWNNGDWKGGIWVTGTWNDGTFSMENATSIWIFGYWYGGDFKNGIWKDGFFNQSKNKLSRYGTESTYQLRSIWENGSFMKGEIHTFANVENGDITQPLISEGYEYTIFNAGEVRSGTCYGATFKQGNWYGGIMLQGYIDARMEVDVTNFIISGDTLTLDLMGAKHYIKAGDRIQIIGSEDTSYLPAISSTHEQIGINTAPGSHIVQAVDPINGNIDILLDSPLIADIDGTLGAYLDLGIVYTVHNGTWENSLWNGGLWLNGTWNGGIWVSGIWDNGKWMDESNPQP